METARAMCVNISYTEVSISHRLQTRNRKRGESEPIIAKFTKRTVKNDILKSKHHLKHSDNHYNVYVQEQLTRERSTALYQLMKEGFRVFTNECRLEYTKGELHGTINSLEELQSKLGWDDEKLIEVVKKLQSNFVEEVRRKPLTIHQENQNKLLVLNVRGIVSKLNLKEIQKIVKEYDVIGLTETLTNAFDYNEIEEHEVSTGMDKLCLKGIEVWPC